MTWLRIHQLHPTNRVRVSGLATPSKYKKSAALVVLDSETAENESQLCWAVHKALK